MSQDTYNRTIWVNESDPPISAGNLNNIEEGVEGAHAHIANKVNPHGVTRAQIGAAGKAEHDSHVTNKLNPHAVTAVQIGAAGKAEHDSHVTNELNPHAVTAVQIGAAGKVEHDSHVTNVSNPHAVTAAQVGAPTTLSFEAHRGSEANPHKVTHAQTSPEGVKDGANAQRSKHVSDVDFSNWESHRGGRSNPHEVTHAQVSPEAVNLASENVLRNKHISDSDGKRWEDHVNHANPHENHETPAGAQAKVDEHANRTDNPHNLTAMQIGAIDLSLLTTHETNETLHVTAEQRASLDYSEYSPTGENPVVTATELHNAMSGAVRGAVATITELAGISPAQRADRDMRLVEERGKIYRFDSTATEGDLSPDEGDGYWIAVASATQNHNNLTGIQGGDAGLQQYYHLNRNDYDALTEHYEQMDNPHNVTAVQAGAIAAINGVPSLNGNITLAFEGDDVRIMNDSEGRTILLFNDHNARTNNPHNVTHDQVYPLSVEYGTDVARDKHLSDADYARWEDHRNSKTNPHNVTAIQTGALVSINGVAGSNGDILVVYEGGDLETISDPTSGVIRLINNHNERWDNPHGITHDQVDPPHVEYGADTTRNKHLSNADFTTLEDHRVATVAHGATPNATAERMVMRDAEGKAKVADPQEDQDIATKKYVDDQVGAVSEIPAGLISMWSGDVADVPSDWALCDGANGTPDLTERFVEEANYELVYIMKL